ncbi:MAG: DJ-1/PfpI family protein [Ruminococcaceae bacterium]|nr:DJ-1/PfpI family protein [Oscillospiraceae bacterium]
MIYVFLANGFEESEAVVTVDVIRRCDLDVKTVSVDEDLEHFVTGAHGIAIKADILISEVSYDDMDAIVLPGGMPGTKNLENSADVRQAIKFCADNDKLIAAICAAPSILGHMGLLYGKKATCFPGFERELHCGVFTGSAVQVDGNIITADGPGSAVLFGEAIAAYFVGDEQARSITETMQCRF